MNIVIELPVYEMPAITWPKGGLWFFKIPVTMKLNSSSATRIIKFYFTLAFPQNADGKVSKVSVMDSTNPKDGL